MSDLQTIRTPEIIGAEIRMYADAGRRVTLLCAIEIGRRLNEAKEMINHGEWLPWLERETDFSDRQAQRYMKVFNEYGAAQLGLFGPETNTTSLSDLPISKALLLLSVPESEREQFAAEVGAEDLSTRELEKAIREKQEAEQRARDAERALEEAEEGQELALAELQEKLDRALEDGQKGREALRHQEDLQQQLDDAGRKLQEAEREIKELESRPIEVAVQRDEKAIEEAVMKAKAEASSEWAEKLKRVQDSLDKAKASEAKLKDKVTKAGADAEKKAAEAERETARIRQEMEQLRKQLKAAEANVAAFGIYFKAIQENANRMFDKLIEIGTDDPETAKKLRTGARTLFKMTMDRLGEE